MWKFLVAALAWMIAAPTYAQTISLDIDISRAERLLELACSGEAIDREEFAQSHVLQAQLAHHRAFGERFSLENYLTGLEAMAQCEVLESDPFRFRYMVENREHMTAAIAFLSDNREELTNRAIALLRPYVPEDFDYEGEIVLAGASFSCGGFQNEGIFFIDIPCLSGDIEGEYDAIVKLIAHETYHAMQQQFAGSYRIDEDTVSTMAQAWDFMFMRLALEGSASHVGDMRNIEGEGRYAEFSRSLARRNFRHLPYNFQLFGFMMEALGQDAQDIETRFPQIYGLTFDGAFGEHGYFMGQQMTAEIAHSFGTRAVPCVLALPLENFALAYDAALADDDNLEESVPLMPSTLAIARQRSEARTETANLDACITT